MSVRDDKNKIIEYLGILRAKVEELSNKYNEDKIHDIQRFINKIHDKVFSI